MAILKKLLNKPQIWFCLATFSVLIIWRCAQVSENFCGDNPYDPGTRFCYEGAIYLMCDDSHYNPETQFCANDSEIHSKCGSYDYNLTTHFCHNNAIYEKCNNQVYTPPNNPCNFYALTVNINPSGDGTVSRNPDQTTYAADTRVTVTATAALGYKFTGWTGASTSTEEVITITMDGNMELTANFEKRDVTYALTTNRNPVDGGRISRNPNLSRYEAGTEVILTAVLENEYEFIGWTIGTEIFTSNPMTITMNSDMAITANFKLKNESDVTYTLTTNVNPISGGTISRNPDLTSYTAGTQVTVTATAAAGYRFTGWSGISSSTNTPVTITMNSNQTLTANFEQIPQATYTLTTNVNPTGGGTISRNPDLISYTAGTQVTVTATAAAGYRFTGWLGISSPTNTPVMIIMGSNMAVTANFELIEDEKLTYRLRVSTFPEDGSGGTVTRNPSSADSSYKEGTIVTLTATAKSGSDYKFVRWMYMGQPVTYNPVAIAMDSDKTIRAEFEKVQVERDHRLVNNTNEAWTSCDQYGSCGDAYVFRSNGTFSRAFKLNNATSWIPVETGTWYTSSTNKLTTVSNFTWTTEYTISTNNLTIDGENYDRTSGVTLP